MTIGRQYHILEPVGKGSFGTVYRATLTSEGGFTKACAVKILNADMVGWEETARRLRDEARVLGLVRHRAILQVDGLVQLGDRWAMVMEFLQGASLLDVVRKGRIPIGVALEIIGEVAGALHVAYTGKGPDGNQLCLIHRDIKPSNIQLTPAGEVKLLDFGIARADYEGRESETHAVLLGSLGYMAPERFDMEDGPEGDIYALGVVLCEIVSGKKFGKTSSVPDKHHDHVEAALAKTRKRAGRDFAVIEKLVRRTLEWDPADRPTARELERMCRELRGRAGGPWLNEWSETRVGPLIEESEKMPTDELFGVTLSEGGQGEFTQEVDAPDTPANDPVTFDPTAAQPPPGATGSALLYVGAALTGLLLVLVCGAGSFLLGQGTATGETAPPPPPQGDGLVDGAGGESSDAVVGDDTDVPQPADASGERDTDKPDGSGGTHETDGPAEAPEPADSQGSGERPAEDGGDGGAADAGTPPPKQPTAATAGPLITAGDYASWLSSHGDWLPEAAMTAGKADANYLRGWSGATPPDPGAPVTNVSWWAARAFCAGRGGLADINASPRTWAGDQIPYQEWRDAGGQAAWRRFDDATSTAVNKSQANTFTGFRCKR